MVSFPRKRESRPGFPIKLGMTPEEAGMTPKQHIH